MQDIDPRRHEEVLLNATAPPEQLLYDGWLIRLSSEHIKRASSVNVLYPSTLDLETKVDYCEAAYRSRDLLPIFRLTSISGAEALDALLERRGYRTFEPSLVQAADLSGLVAPALAPGLHFEQADVRPWTESIAPLRGWAEADAEARIRRMTSSALPSHCLGLMAGTEVACCGLVTVDGEYAGLFDIYTVPEYRGKGFASALCARLLEIGAGEGAKVGWLSVLADNAPALSVYRRLGFETAYHYWYRVPPDY